MSIFKIIIYHKIVAELCQNILKKKNNCDTIIYHSKRENGRNMKKLIAILLAVCSFAALCYYFYKVRHVVVYGHTLTLDSHEVKFSGPEIDNVDNLIENMKQMNDVKLIDLGSYLVHADDEAKLCNSFPNTDMVYKTYIDMFGDRILTDITTLDISDKDLSDLTDLRNGIPYLTNLERVVSTGSSISHDQKESLEKEFQNIDFDIVSTYTIYGKTVRDDSEALDLTDVAVDEKLSDNLRLFKHLKSVDLHGQPLSPDDQLKLVGDFPDVDFGWEVDIGQMKYDSSTEDLDLTDCWWIGADLVRQRIPLFPHLKRLDMSNCGATNEEMAALRADFPNIKVVWFLRMGRWSLKTDAVAFSVLIYDYSHKRLTSEDIEVLKYCTDLQALDVGHQAITDLSVIGDYLPDLRILILADNLISDLTPLSKLKHLHYLEFFVNWQISDLSPLAECKELVDLNISHNGLISDITPLLDLPILERLWLEHTAVPQDQVQLLRETYPNATIIDQGYGSVDQGWRSHPRYFAMIKMYHENYMDELFSMYDGK